MAAAPAVARGGADEFARDVRIGLARSPKQLPPRYLYDALGSSLFDAICGLPWYPITRAESRLLARHAGEILARAGDRAALVDLGSGNGEKVALLTEAATGVGQRPVVHLVDVSARALAVSGQALARVGPVRVVCHRATFEAGLERVAAQRRPREAALILLLGSNIGNFDPPEARALLQAIRASMAPGDRLLLGADLVKPWAELRLAYDDPLGVTAAFNKNLLLRINRELRADFDLAAFDHRATWDPGASRVEMHLVSRRRQVVPITGAGCVVSLLPGETIWTESSHKYRPADLPAMGLEVGLRCEAQWIEPEARFALALFRHE